MRIPLLLVVSLVLSACYTFRGITIPEGVERAYVPVYLNNALSAPPTLALDLTESLRDKVRDEARLVVTEEDPDIEIRGTLVDFRVTAEGASAGNETAAFSKLNRLTVVVAIEYTNLKDPDAENWKSNFTEYFPFPGSQTLASIQDEALAEIFENLNEKIFNRAFADEW
ncbi:LPS assembly lipoprotein LptE [Neolewinella litorea]|uniref:Lipopolysaccharide-assembly n=1 Tax=Neolewinella litorea TaxID=2562452 RepID=A0A4S4NZK6_9BACT|nr:LPS assembly lipoprotein LptE [Neolewinella litorea]THH41740.1 hypothetical protein E4021_03860 [Neolewinella litorea]